MTTTVKVHVNGNYRASVHVEHENGQTEDRKIGPNAEQAISLQHPAEATITIVEEPVPEVDEREGQPAGQPASGNSTPGDDPAQPVDAARE